MRFESLDLLQGNPFGIILEDDMLLSPEFRNCLTLIDRLPSDGKWVALLYYRSRPSGEVCHFEYLVDNFLQP